MNNTVQIGNPVTVQTVPLYNTDLTHPNIKSQTAPDDVTIKGVF